MRIINSREKCADKRKELLKKKYGDKFHVWFSENKRYLEIKLKKGKWLEKNVMDVDRDSIDLYKDEYIGMAKDIAKRFEIELIELY